MTYPYLNANITYGETGSCQLKSSESFSACWQWESLLGNSKKPRYAGHEPCYRWASASGTPFIGCSVKISGAYAAPLDKIKNGLIFGLENVPIPPNRQSAFDPNPLNLLFSSVFKQVMIVGVEFVLFH
jgi:hypothetical protein